MPEILKKQGTRTKHSKHALHSVNRQGCFAVGLNPDILCMIVRHHVYQTTICLTLTLISDVGMLHSPWKMMEPVESRVVGRDSNSAILWIIIIELLGRPTRGAGLETQIQTNNSRLQANAHNGINLYTVSIKQTHKSNNNWLFINSRINSYKLSRKKDYCVCDRDEANTGTEEQNNRTTYILSSELNLV